jgi:hypothetical protein
MHLEDSGVRNNGNSVRFQTRRTRQVTVIEIMSENQSRQVAWWRGLPRAQRLGHQIESPCQMTIPVRCAYLPESGVLCVLGGLSATLPWVTSGLPVDSRTTHENARKWILPPSGFKALMRISARLLTLRRRILQSMLGPIKRTRLRVCVTCQLSACSD